MIVGVTEGDFDAVLSMMDVSLPTGQQQPSGEVGSQAAGEGTVEDQREQEPAASSVAAAAAPVMAAAAAPPTATSQGTVEQPVAVQQQQQPEEEAGEQGAEGEERREVAAVEEMDRQAGCMGDVQRGCFCALVEKVWELFTLLCTV